MNLYVTSFILFFDLCSASESSLLYNLTRKIFTDYNPAVLPECPNRTRVNLVLTITLLQVLKVDERQQLVKLNLWVGMRWKDCALSWNPSDYDNITTLVLPVNRFWIPDVSFKDSLSTELWGITDYTGTIYHYGLVEYSFPTVLEVPCPIDARNFPFDEQVCDVTVGPWMYDLQHLDISTFSKGSNLALLKSNKEWDVLKIPGIKRNFSHTGSEMEFAELVYSIHLKRKPNAYVHNLIEPSMIVLMVGSVGHLIPIDSGGKISFELTILDSFVWFKLLTVEQLPVTTENRPILDIYMTFAFFVIAISTFWQVLVVYLYALGDKTMGEWTEIYVLRPMLLLIFACRKMDRDEILNDAENEKWRVLATCIDRLGFMLYITTCISGFLYYYYLIG